MTCFLCFLADFQGFEQFEAQFRQGAPAPDAPVEENSILGAAKYRNSVRIAKWIEQRKTIGDLEKANIIVNPQVKTEEIKHKKNVLDRFFKKDVEKRAAAAPAAATAAAPKEKTPAPPKEDPKKPKPKEEKKGMSSFVCLSSSCTTESKL